MKNKRLIDQMKEAEQKTMLDLKKLLESSQWTDSSSISFNTFQLQWLYSWLGIHCSQYLQKHLLSKKGKMKFTKKEMLTCHRRFTFLKTSLHNSLVFLFVPIKEMKRTFFSSNGTKIPCLVNQTNGNFKGRSVLLIDKDMIGKVILIGYTYDGDKIMKEIDAADFINEKAENQVLEIESKVLEYKTRLLHSNCFKFFSRNRPTWNYIQLNDIETKQIGLKKSINQSQAKSIASIFAQLSKSNMNEIPQYIGITYEKEYDFDDMKKILDRYRNTTSIITKNNLEVHNNHEVSIINDYVSNYNEVSDSYDEKFLYLLEKLGCKSVDVTMFKKNNNIFINDILKRIRTNIQPSSKQLKITESSFLVVNKYMIHPLLVSFAQPNNKYPGTVHWIVILGDVWTLEPMLRELDHKKQKYQISTYKPTAQYLDKLLDKCDVNKDYFKSILYTEMWSHL